MKTYEKCLLCFERQAVDVCNMSGLGDKETEAVLDAVRASIESFSLDCPPVRMAVEINELIRKESSLNDPYECIKQVSNDVCSQMSPFLAETVASAGNQLMMAVKIAIAGNIIDCGAYGVRTISKTKLMSTVREILAQSLAGSLLSDFERVVNDAEQILYIGDNAGECFFDVPLLDLLPLERVTYAVRGGPVLNDATFRDAKAAGIQNRCSLIDTGDNAPGVLFERCSDEFKSCFESSDLIISKGQGNYESLSEVKDKRIVFLTKVKCEMIADDIGNPLNSNVLKIINSTSGKERNLQRADCKLKREVSHA